MRVMTLLKKMFLHRMAVSCVDELLHPSSRLKWLQHKIHPSKHSRISSKISVHATNAYVRVALQCQSCCISALDGGEWSVSCPSQFTPEKKCLYPLNRRLGGPQSWRAKFGEENIFSLLGHEPKFLHHPLLRLVTIMTELS